MAIVTLNVGGVLYQTSKETLEKNDTYFRPLVTHSNVEEIIFIDRDPAFFRYILNWLRGSSILPEDTVSLQELAVEADFYCMQDLKEAINSRLMTSTTSIEQMKRFGDELKYAYR